MTAGWRDRRFTNVVRYLLDDWLPPVVRDRRLPIAMLASVFHGPGFDLDFKRKAHHMSDAEFTACYARLTPRGRQRYRITDMTEAQLRWMIDNTVGPDVLEVGCGQGVLAERLAARGDVRVLATDLCEPEVAAAERRVASRHLPIAWRVADLERLPFPDRSFDTVLCAHTLEHVRRFENAVRELVRVARRRLLVNVPCQRFHRYTVDYHLHFFPEPEQLLLRMGLLGATCERISGDLCYRKDFDHHGHGPGANDGH